MSGKINVYGLQSFTDPSEAWKVISSDFGSYEIGMNPDGMDTYMINFNFFLYSQKNKKFYTSIVETKNGSCSGALSEEEKFCLMNCTLLIILMT